MQETHTQYWLKAETSSGKVLTYSSGDAGACSSAPTGHQHKGGFQTHTHYPAKNGCNYNISRWHNFSPVLMIIVGMGLVYMIYPAIAPGMIVPFYLVDKIDMILLIATAVPPVIVATLKKYEYGPFVFLGNWGGNHTPPWLSTAESDAITKATLNLNNIDTQHTLTFQKGSDVQEVKYTVSDDQRTAINSIKKETTANATINLTLNLTDVTLKDSTSSTLKASGSITTTRKVAKGAQDLTVQNALKAPHTLSFATSSGSTLTQKNLTKGTVIIGPEGHHKKLDLNATGDGPTNLKLELKDGTASDGTTENKTLTLDTNNQTLTLTGGVGGTLTFSSGTLTATTITSVKYNLNDFHYTYRTQY